MVDKNSDDKDANKAWWIDYDIGDVINPKSSKLPKFAGEKSKEEKKASKELLIFLIVLILIYIGVVIFWFLNSVPPTISDYKLAEGVLVNLGKGDEVRFNLNEENRKIKVDSLGKTSINVTIQVESIIEKFNIGEIKKFDFNNDQAYDLIVELRNITNKKANLYVKKILEVICFENWSCTDWNNCKNISQTRTCEDLNDCETEESKPAETQECISFEFNCSKSGDTNIDCFMYSAETCSPAKLTYSFTVNTVGWIQDNSHYYEIIGFENGRCELYQKVISASGKYSDTKRQTLLNEGDTDEEINKSELDRNAALQNFTGKTGVCRYTTYYLVNMLKELKEAGINLPVENPGTYECNGTLYGDNETLWLE